MIYIRIYTGNKAICQNGFYYYEVYCRNNDDIDIVHEILVENIKLNNPGKDLIDFENVKDANVNTMLQDAKKQRLILDYEIEDFKLNKKSEVKIMKDFETLPTTKEDWFDKYQALLKAIDDREDELAHLKNLNKKYFRLAEKISKAE